MGPIRFSLQRIPSLRWLQAFVFPDVFAIIDHLKVAIYHQQFSLTANFLTKLAEIRRDIVEVDFVVCCDIRVEIFQKAGRIKFNAPTSGKNANVNGIRAPTTTI